MISFRIALILMGVSFLSGCRERNSGEPVQEIEPAQAQVTYYDRNGDGKVDLEKHRFLEMADADSELRDDNFDGRYEKEILFGVGVFEKAANLPVPTGVKIEPAP